VTLIILVKQCAILNYRVGQESESFCCNNFVYCQPAFAFLAHNIHYGKFATE